MLKVIGHRPVQAGVIVLLSALISTCAAFAPLYQRALDQAAARVELERATPGAAQLRVTSSGQLPTTSTGRRQPAPALTPEELDQQVPPAARESLEPPIAAHFVDLTMPRDSAHPSDGRLAWRESACAHVALDSGACPSTAGQILVSTADAANFGWTTGTRLPVTENQSDDTLGRPRNATLVVTGVYVLPDDPYWEGWALTGGSGSTVDRNELLHDTWLTDEATFDAGPRWRNPSTRLDYSVDDARIGIDELLALGPAVTAFEREVRSRHAYGPVVQVLSGLPDIADRARQAKADSRVTIPALLGPLAVLGLVVLWMALGAATEQRRPEVAVARLRGRGVRGAQAHVLRELEPLVLAGVPVGVLAAFALSWSARRLALPRGVPTEAPASVWLAAVLAAALVSAAAVAVSAGISREPIAALLRRVPVRRSGWRLGTGDVVVLTAAASILGAFVSGRLTGPVALVAPGVIALAAGLLLARLLVPAATWSGRWMLGRGRAVPAVAMLQLARRSGTRATIALLTVSAGILVFAADAVAVGSRNRDLAATQQVGAPMVATVSGGNVRSVLDVVRSERTAEHDLTAVVVRGALSDADQANLFVDPAAFRRIAALPGGAVDAATGHLSGPDVQPIELVGRELSVEVGTADFYDGSHRPVELAMQLLDHDGLPVEVRLGVLPVGTSAPRRVGAAIDCAAGCTLTGWRLLTDPANAGYGRLTLTSMRTDGQGTVNLGATSDWTPTDSQGVQFRVMQASLSSLTLFLDNPGSSDILLQHRWVPAALPVVVTGALPDDATGRRYTGTGMDGVSRRMAVVGRLRWLPAVGLNAGVSDLDLAARTGMVLDERARLQIWFSDEDAGTLARVRKALHERHLGISDVQLLSVTRRALDRSTAAWSLELGALVGACCLVMGVLGLAVAGAASWRPRTRDLAILALNGAPTRAVRRISVVEQLPAIAAAVVAGAAGGVLAAHYALPTLPLLPDDPPVDLVDLSTAWQPVLLVAALTAVALVAAGAGVGAAVARRARPERAAGAA